MSTLPTRLRRSRRDRVLITPEGIALPITVGSKGARIGAVALDLIFILALIVGITLALFYMAGGAAGLLRQIDRDSPGADAFNFLVVVWIIAVFLLRNAYFLYFELGPRGATPGKRLVGIRVAARDGGRLTAEMVLARNLLRDVELVMPLLLIATIGEDSGLAWLAATAWFALLLGLPLFNRDALRAGDIIAGTWVVERPRHKLEAVLATLAPTPARAEPDDRASDPATPRGYQFSPDELSHYGEFELQALERVLRDNRPEAIEAVCRTIAGKIGRADGWNDGGNGGWNEGGNDERAFLQAYYSQLRARLEAGMRMGRRKADKHSKERG